MLGRRAHSSLSLRQRFVGKLVIVLNEEIAVVRRQTWQTRADKSGAS